MIKTKRKGNGLLAVIKYLVVTAWKNDKWYLVFIIAISICSGFSNASLTYFKQIFYDSVGNAVQGTGTSNTAIYLGLLMGFVMVVILLLDALCRVFTQNMGQKLIGYLGIDVNKKAAEIEPICYENSDMLDSINKAYKGIEVASSILDAFLYIITFFIPYFIFMAIYLIHIKPLLFLCIIFAFLPSIIGQIIRYKSYANLERSSAPLRRKYEYYERCINDREFAKETRLIGGFWFFRNLYQCALDIMSKKAWKTAKKVELTELVIRFLLLIGYLGTIFLMFVYLIKGDIGVGAFAAILASIDQMFDFMENLVNYNIGTIMENLGLAQNLMDFMQLPVRKGEERQIKNAEIELSNVSFKYPNAAEKTLHNINLKIKDGETIAIVGENGAGKSTLVKLIMGLYLPSCGEVSIGGEDTCKISAKSAYRNISAVFQQFQRYKMTLMDNVTISHTKESVSEQQLMHGIKKSGVDLENRSFSDGLDTMLSREFGGIDLSGGQWQRIAIARGLYRNHNIIILDEPTAAIDPIEETRLYEKFTEISHGKTTIIVTHRLGSAKIADRIIVMDKGQIADSGTHEELMGHDGIYREMYEAQAKWYIR